MSFKDRLNAARLALSGPQEEGASAPNRKELGATGSSVFSGLLYEDEYNRDLQGEQAIKTYDRMRRSDGQVKAGLLACKLPLLVARWDIEPASDSEEDMAIAGIVRDDMLNGMRDTWDDFLRQALLMLDFGHMPFEKVWELRDERWTWRKMGPRLPASIQEWHIKTDGELDFLRQSASNGEAFRTVDIPADKLLVFTYEKEGSNYRGISLLRAAYKHWYYKNNLYAIDGMAAERHGLGLAAFTYPDTATTAQKDAIKNIGERLHAHERAYIAHPDSIKFDLKGVQGQLHDIMRSIDHHDLQIVRSILAQFMNLGAKSTGSYALSQDQSQFFLMALQSVGRNVCNTINRHAIREMVDYNWNVDKYPKLTVSGLDSPDMMGYAQAIASLVTAGAITSDLETENELRRMVKLPAKKGQRPEVQPKPAATPVTPPADEDQLQASFKAGGEGSGNFDHEGRPGEVGGSGSGGGGGSSGKLPSLSGKMWKDTPNKQDYIQHITNDVLSKEQNVAVKDWGDAGYLGYRSQQQRGEATPELTAALDKLPKYEGTVYRGGRMDDTLDPSSLAGKAIKLKADTSGSASHSAADVFLSDFERRDATPGVPVMYELKAKTGADIRPVVARWDEEEIVLRQGTQYQVTSIEKKTHQYGFSYYLVKGEER
jgi:hypothetical protein